MTIDYFDSNESKMSSAAAISFIIWLIDENFNQSGRKNCEHQIFVHL